MLRIEAPTIQVMLQAEFMEPLGLSAYALAKGINVPAFRAQVLLHGRRKISADTSLRSVPSLECQEISSQNFSAMSTCAAKD